MCLSDLSSLVIEGANGTCGPEAPLAAGVLLALAVTLGLAIAVSSRRPRASSILLVGLAIPGWWALRSRADMPPRLDDSVAKVAAFSQQIEAFAIAHHRCVALQQVGCDTCDPIVRYAIAPLATCESPAAIVLGDDALSVGCRETGGVLHCGSSP